MTNNEKIIRLVYLLINCISPKSATQMLSLKEESQPAYIGPQDLPGAFSSNVPRTSLKILFGHPGDVPI